MAEIEGSALVAQSIGREGIETLFGLAGGPIQDIMGSAPHFGVRPIGVRHEQAATLPTRTGLPPRPTGTSATRWGWRCWPPVRR